MCDATDSKQVYLPIYIQRGRKRYYLNLNRYRNWHYRLSNDLKVCFKTTIKYQLNFRFDQKIQIKYTYYAPDNRKRDLMNVIAVVDKFFQDAMTENHCIPSDDTDTVIAVSCTYGGIDRKNPRIEAHISEHLHGSNSPVCRRSSQEHC